MHMNVIGRILPPSGKVHQNQEVFDPRIGGVICTIKACCYKDPPKILERRSNMPTEIGTLKGLGGVYDNCFDQSGRVYDPVDTSPTIHTMGGGNQSPKILEHETGRVRKLTPKECWRLMGFDDEDYNKASKVCSPTQLYKQAGNSIVVNCLEEILKNLLPAEQPQNSSLMDWLDSILEVSK